MRQTRPGPFTDTPLRGGCVPHVSAERRRVEGDMAESSDVRRLNGMQHVAPSHRLRAIHALRADTTGARSASVCCCCC
ncbi:Uncharacterised protein [Mycobacteroides abscessus subsp. massiliense]|nr:Uncharacterised protein [Mycobacteroides abscessus subsp. massiliense]